MRLHVNSIPSSYRDLQPREGTSKLRDVPGGLVRLLHQELVTTVQLYHLAPRIIGSDRPLHIRAQQLVGFAGQDRRGY